MSVSSNIKRLRIQAGMTQEELAERMFVSRQTVSSWETNRNQPDVDTLISLATIFETDVNELIYGRPKGSYPKTQNRYIWMIILSVLFLVLLGVIRGIILPHWMESRGKKYLVGPSFYVFPCALEAAIFLIAGFLNCAVFSLWFNCSVTNKKRALICGIALLQPILLLLLELLLYHLGPEQFWHYFVFLALHHWLRVLLFWIFPLVSGVLFFLFFNTDKNKSNSSLL